MQGKPSAPEPRPKTIKNDVPDHRVLVGWNNDEEHVVAWIRARWNCPCAVCQGEFGTPGRLAYTTELTDDETTLEAMKGIGNYGVAMIWKDGHDTGIYPWPLLYRLGIEEKEGQPYRELEENG